MDAPGAWRSRRCIGYGGVTHTIHTHNLVAFLAVLTAIVLLALAGKATDLAIMTGLVGVLGSFKPWGSVAPAPTPKDASEGAQMAADAAVDKADEIKDAVV
jgi:hypothetical protein